MRNGEGRDQFPSNEFNPLVTKTVELPHNMYMLKNSSNENISNHSTVYVEAQDPGYLLQQRLELVEDLWKTVLKSECPPGQTERLLRLKQLSDPGKSNQENSSQAIVQLITEMDLVEAISAARAFSLYFQLVNNSMFLKFKRIYNENNYVRHWLCWISLWNLFFRVWF